MYFDITKGVLDTCIQRYRRRNRVKRRTVDDQIAQHILDTSDQHRQPDPDINYDDPLCRLGYLYMHLAANATLFERSIRESDLLRQTIRNFDGDSLAVCTVGGGPGTELTGLLRFLRSSSRIPARIKFTVLDSVPEWAETWDLLADASEAALRDDLDDDRIPTIAPMFHPMDVMDAESYESYPWLFERQDIVVFNYLLSENQVRLDDFEDTLAWLVANTSVRSQSSSVIRVSGLSDPKRSIASRYVMRRNGRSRATPPASAQPRTVTSSSTARTSSTPTKDISRSTWVNSSWRSARSSSSRKQRAIW